MSTELNINYTVYEFSPIDIWFPMHEFREYYINSDYKDKRRLRSLLKTSLNLLADSSACWEGDVRGDELHLGFLLDPDVVGGTIEYFGLKQDNNGSSFLIFPCEMPLYKEWQCTNESRYHRDLSKKIDDIVNDFAPDTGLKDYLKENLRAIHEYQNQIDFHLLRIRDMSISIQGE